MQAGLGVEEATDEVHQATESENKAEHGQNAEEGLEGEIFRFRSE